MRAASPATDRLRIDPELASPAPCQNAGIQVIQAVHDHHDPHDRGPHDHGLSGPEAEPDILSVDISSVLSSEPDDYEHPLTSAVVPVSSAGPPALDLLMTNIYAVDDTSSSDNDDYASENIDFDDLSAIPIPADTTHEYDPNDFTLPAGLGLALAAHDASLRPSVSFPSTDVIYHGALSVFPSEPGPEHHPEPVDYYDQAMSDSDGGAPLDGVPFPTMLELEQAEQVPPLDDFTLTYDDDEIEVDHGLLPGAEDDHDDFTLPDDAIMTDTILAGIWTPTFNPTAPTAPHQAPQEDMFEPIDEPVLLSNPNPMMLGSENLGLIDFLRNWAHMARLMPPPPSERKLKVPSLPSIREQAILPVDEVGYEDLDGDFCDLQGVNWKDMGTTRRDARERRYLTYRNYVNKEGSDKWTPHVDDVAIPSRNSFFRYKNMQFRQDVSVAHFQLRSVLACPTRTQAFYPGPRGINRVNPISRKTEVALSMSEFTGTGAMISTLDAKHGILMAGTFSGEYCLKNLESEDRKNFSDGQITANNTGITNHLQIYQPRRSGGPVAALASNDHGFRVMDLTTEKFLLESVSTFPLNCTAISPDRRLRVMVGDSTNVLIVNAETNEVQRELEGHRDFGFSCDWSDDGWTVATGFQDRGIKIWDARRWCDSSGRAMPLCTIRSEMAGVRSLRFSPNGSGAKVLVAAEEADYVNIIDAQTFHTKQTVDIFGEIGGISFTNEGQGLTVLCSDLNRGGLLQLERCGQGPEPFYNNSWSRRPMQSSWRCELDNTRQAREPHRRKPIMLDALPLF
ncbi:hypothetical protein G7046_g4449 [Stylonectria norvegica]|nr:hypothetical protein G7046_g4449 [Stylonectria norvegica]